jgi:hypothetical protein
MAYVKHNTWFNFELDGQEYRAKYIDVGFTYASFRIKRQVITKSKKYWLFGPNIENKSWDYIVWNSGDANGESVRRELYYDATETKRRIQNYILRIKKEHSKRI